MGGCDVLRLSLRKPRGWRWELTTSASSPAIVVPEIELVDRHSHELLWSSKAGPPTSAASSPRQSSRRPRASKSIGPTTTENPTIQEPKETSPVRMVRSSGTLIVRGSPRASPRQFLPPVSRSSSDSAANRLSPSSVGRHRSAICPTSSFGKYCPTLDPVPQHTCTPSDNKQVRWSNVNKQVPSSKSYKHLPSSSGDKRLRASSEDVMPTSYQHVPSSSGNKTAPSASDHRKNRSSDSRKRTPSSDDARHVRSSSDSGSDLPSVIISLSRSSSSLMTPSVTSESLPPPRLRKRRRKVKTKSGELPSAEAGT
ncbi:Hypothetical protein NTJ_05041 [Nesidiocoris tenuis]|uniref:Uncharacterized protein n=1 Tax=Nesidiocoris tenuis TaxID=355587 RepID=A0ABN7AIZ1_9HEMI|nr:Hypothetical protein NTJ_05041 [Nesidiocoris tenuis]